jgi:glycosyltransferase involved in cell wall biosynthesis
MALGRSINGRSVIILTFVDYYLPGYRGGGPVRTVANLVERLGHEFHFKIITRDRDFMDQEPYRDVKVDEWSKLGKAEVFYASSKSTSVPGIRRILTDVPFDVLYLNSFFSPRFTITPLVLRRLGLFGSRPVIVAPRGEFSPGAVALKRQKKRVYLRFARVLGLYHPVVWQASAPLEREQILRYFGPGGRVMIAANLGPAVDGLTAFPTGTVRGKQAGRLRAVFISRISPIKNLLGALEILSGVKGEIDFHIFGPIDDTSYWKRCQCLMALLPQNVHAEYKGGVRNEYVIEVLNEYHLLFLPTLGENFGHAILEALVSGCPVLISDETPWKNLEAEGVGWDLPLSQPDCFRRVIEEYIAMGPEEHARLSARARGYGLNRVNDAEAVEQNRRLFYKAMSGG